MESKRMKARKNMLDRRDFIKTVGSAGLGSVFLSGQTMAASNESRTGQKGQEPKFPQVPKRKLGKTDLKVPTLSLGGNQDLLENQIVLRVAPQRGVNFWDTAHNYRGGNSEIGIGRYLSRNPEARKQLLIATKASHARTIADVQERFETSLERMNTDYIDVYYGVHRCSDPTRLTDELKQWAERAKKEKRIRFFGFTTHQNMARCLTAAAKLDWIDVVMLPYSFRLMQDKELDGAVDACHKAGIGLIAMKTQGFGPRTKADEQRKLMEHFLQRGLTAGQAKIKLVLEDERFSAACVGMKDVATLTENVAAVLDKTELSDADKRTLTGYARRTCSGYCAGCAHICDAALPDAPYVSDIMRYLMYYNSYADRAEARELFARVPREMRDKLLDVDYAAAEARCPQHLPIGRLVAEAVRKLA